MSTAALISDVSSPTTASRAAGERALPTAAVTRYARAATSSSLSAAPAARLGEPARVEVAPRGQQDDRDLGGDGVALEPAADLVPVHLRHHHVHDNHLRSGVHGAGELDPRPPRTGGRHVPARCELECAPHEHEEVGVIINDQRPKGFRYGPVLVRHGCQY